MKNVFAGVVFSLMVVSSVAGFAQSSAVVAQAKAAQAEKVTGTLKGVIKKIDDASVTLTPSSNKNAEVVLQINAATKRSGAVAAGDQVAVTYYIENGARVATALAGKASK